MTSCLWSPVVGSSRRIRDEDVPDFLEEVFLAERIVSIVPGKEATQEELIDFCRDNIASYKKPRSVTFVNELPKNNYGKIVKRELRADYWEGKERKVI